MTCLVRLSKLAILALSVLATVGCATEPFYDSVPAVPLNVSPIEEANIAANSPVTFQWQASDNAHYYEFHIFNRTNNDIEQYRRNNLRPDDVCINGMCSLELAVALPLADDHAWRVRAGNNAGLSNWSRTRFNMVSDGSGNGAVIQTAPGVPTPLQPNNGTSLKPASMVAFVWRSVPEATSYDFHLFDSVSKEMVDALSDLPATTLCQGASDCRLTRLVDLPPATGHAWRVRAVNRNGQSPWTRSVFNIKP